MFDYSDHVKFSNDFKILVNIWKISKNMDFRMKSIPKNKKWDGKNPNACKIEIMNVIMTIRFI